MIRELNLKHGLDVWVNQQLEHRIEEEFKKLLETEELFYYTVPCNCHNNGENEVKWYGKIRLKDFIKKVQKNDYHFYAVGVTNSRSKSKLNYYFENDFYSKNPEVWDYWIGDIVGKEVVCGDDMFIALWNRIRDSVTVGSKTKRSF